MGRNFIKGKRNIILNIGTLLVRYSKVMFSEAKSVCIKFRSGKAKDESFLGFQEYSRPQQLARQKSKKSSLPSCLSDLID